MYCAHDDHAWLQNGMDLPMLSRRARHSKFAFTFDRYGKDVKAKDTAAVAENTQRRWQAASES